MTAISTRAISRSTCAPEPPLVQPDNQSLLLSARSPDSIQRYAPPARSGSSAPPPPSAAGAPFPSPPTSRYSGACAISPPRAPGAPRSASALPSNIASPTMPRSRVVSLAIAACARTSSTPGATPPFSTSKCSTRAEPRDYAGFKPFGALAVLVVQRARVERGRRIERVLAVEHLGDLAAGVDDEGDPVGVRLPLVLHLDSVGAHHLALRIREQRERQLQALGELLLRVEIVHRDAQDLGVLVGEPRRDVAERRQLLRSARGEGLDRKSTR